MLLSEVIGGYVSNSLALISDEGHMVTDVMAISLGLLAFIISRRSPNKNATFGYGRVGLLAALINGVSLLGIALYIFYESYERLVSPPEIKLSVMLSIAALGLAGNLLMVVILDHEHDDLNIKSVCLHL